MNENFKKIYFFLKYIQYETKVYGPLDQFDLISDS